jgi:hypothetical protein
MKRRIYEDICTHTCNKIIDNLTDSLSLIDEGAGPEFMIDMLGAIFMVVDTGLCSEKQCKDYASLSKGMRLMALAALIGKKVDPAGGIVQSDNPIAAAQHMSRAIRDLHNVGARK